MSIVLDEVPMPTGEPDAVANPTAGMCEVCTSPVPLSKGGRQFSKCIVCRREARANAAPGAAVKRNPNWEGPLAAQLTDMFDGIGMAVSFVEPYDGTAIRRGAPRLGDALIGPARTNRKVRTALENVVAGGAWASVIMAVAAIALPILSHHGLIPSIPAPQRPAAAKVDPSDAGHIRV